MNFGRWCQPALGRTAAWSLASFILPFAIAHAQVVKPPPPPKQAPPRPAQRAPQNQQRPANVPPNQNRTVPPPTRIQRGPVNNNPRVPPRQPVNAPGSVSGPGNRPGATPYPRNTSLTTRGGQRITTDSTGRVRTIQDTAHGMNVERTPNHLRTVSTTQPNGSHLVGFGHGYGYRDTAIPGHRGYLQRTYVQGGVHYSRVYREGTYRGIRYNRYVPGMVYSRRFYAWEANRWATPVASPWGWQAQPWYGFYQGYFAPAPYYADASLMLADFIIAEGLQQAYALQQQSCGNCDPTLPQGDDAAPPVPISDDMKAQIAGEVRAELNEEANGGAPIAADALPPALDPQIQTFLVSASLTLDNGDSSCGLASGDLLFRVDAVVNEGKVNIRVEDSQPGDCPVNTVSQLDVATLQEMHNHFREVMDTGQQFAAQNEGNNGFPPGPPPDARLTPEAQTIVDDSQQVQSDLASQQQQADVDEAQLQQETPPMQPAVSANESTGGQSAPVDTARSDDIRRARHPRTAFGHENRRPEDHLFLHQSQSCVFERQSRVSELKLGKPYRDLSFRISLRGRRTAENPHSPGEAGRSRHTGTIQNGPFKTGLARR